MVDYALFTHNQTIDGEKHWMKGRYLNPRNSWEIAWNEAFDLRETAKKDGNATEGSLPDPYQNAFDSSDTQRRNENVPEDEWYYEKCRKFTVSELENQRKLEEWANSYMPEEEAERKKHLRKPSHESTL